MNRLRAWTARLGGTFNQRRKDRELDAEIESHLQMHIEDNLRSGMTPEEARRQALIKLGGAESTKEAYRDQRGLPLLETLWQDIRFGVRQLRKNPGFTAVAVLTLALGIGANTAVFSVINATLLRPFPYENPERLTILQERNAGGGLQDVSYSNFADWRQSASFESMAAQREEESFNFSGSGEPERLQGQIVSANFFQTLGIRPFRGRDFLSEDDRPGAAPVAILSYGFWQRRFGADEGVVGKAITLNNQSFTVIGVTPVNFQFRTVADVFVPIGLSAERFRLRGRDPGVGVVARLKPSVSVGQAETELNVIAARLEQEYPETNTGKRVRLESLHENFVGGTRLSLLTLLGAVGLVLLLACVNVANLLLVQGAARHREMALRAALGAGRWRIVRQLLGESLLLAALGGVLGVLLAYWGTNLIMSYLPAGLARLHEVAIDSRVFWFTLGLSLLAGVVFGMAPAWQASRANLTQALQEGGRGSTGSRQRLRNALVVSEIALTLAVLAGAGLLIRSFWKLQRVDSGLDARNVLMMQISVKANPGEAARIADFFEQLLQKVHGLPGVKSVAVADGLPILRDANWAPYNIEGRPPPKPGSQTWAVRYTVSPEYFQTLGVQLLMGRGFTAREKLNSPEAAIIDETFARQHFPNEDPLGKRLILALPDGAGVEIVGVVRHVKHAGLDEQSAGSPQFYLNFNQRRSSASHLLVRSVSDPLSLAGAVRDQVWALNKDQPVFNVRTMEQVVSESIAPRRFSALLMVIFGFVALVLASMGLYGMMSYSVAQRTAEIGIRMALGAQRRDVLRMVIKQALVLALLGVAVGLVTALAAARLLRNLLFGVGTADPLTFGTVAFVLFGVALAASLAPARRASMVDPMVALRSE